MISLILIISGISALILFTLGPLLSHFELIDPLKGLRLLIWGGEIGIINLILSLAAILFYRLRSKKSGFLIPAALPGAVVSLIFLFLFLNARGYPPINDITTTPEAPPQFQRIPDLPENRGKEMAYPDHFAEIQKRSYPDISPRVIEMAPDRLFEKVREAARRMKGWEIVSEDPGTKTIEAVATTTVFRFQDDLIIQVRPVNAGSVAHVRSRSRVGRSDIGANAMRIRVFFAVLKDMTKPV